MLPRHVVIDTLTRVAPLGVRFYDHATGQAVTELEVTARPAASPARELAMFPSRSGVYTLHHAPGLRDFEGGAGDAEFWQRMPAPQPYIVAVSDPRAWFLPFTFEVGIPLKGVLVWEGEPASSPAGPGGVPLFSTPARPTPAGYTVVRADLRDAGEDQPAAWAVVEVRYEGLLLGRGIADARGRLAVPLAYPPPVDFTPLSPLTTGAPLTGQAWRVGVQVWYTRLAPADQPDLRAVLGQLSAPPARVWATWDSPPGADMLAEGELAYGRELVLRTAAGGSPLPELSIAPA